MTEINNDTNEIVVGMAFGAVDENVEIVIRGWRDPLAALAALRIAGTDEYLEKIYQNIQEEAANAEA